MLWQKSTATTSCWKKDLQVRPQSQAGLAVLAIKGQGHLCAMPATWQVAIATERAVLVAIKKVLNNNTRTSISGAV